MLVDIQVNVCGSNEEFFVYGILVIGVGVGNGCVNGFNKGMVFEVCIIVIESNLNVQNWILMVVDVCDFFFSKVDEFGLLVVMNLFVGDYFGSYDGIDLVVVLMLQFVNEKLGRLIVCVVGNVGMWRDFYVGSDVDVDIGYFWF